MILEPSTLLPPTQVHATDKDNGDYGSIRYTKLSGKLADRLELDPLSGLITCGTNNHDLDRELSPGKMGFGGLLYVFISFSKYVFLKLL